MKSRTTRRGRIDPIAFGLAVATMMAATIATLGLTSKVGLGERWRVLFADVYPGFEADDGGTGLGVAWGTIDGFLAGAVLGWLYNAFRRT